MIILIGGEKGGAGKSTLAVNLAAKHALMEGDVLLFDTDKQGSASKWGDLRDANNGHLIPRVPTFQKFGVHISTELKDLHASKYQDIIVDAGGRDSVELRSTMTVANKLYIPIKPSQFDIWTLSTMHRLLTEVKIYNPELRAYVIANQVSTHPKSREVEELEEIINEFEHFSFCKTIIHQRVAFTKCIMSGLSVVEISKQDRNATEELENLYNEVFNCHEQ